MNVKRLMLGICVVLLPAVVMAEEVDDAHSLCLPTGPAPEEGYILAEGVQARGLNVIGGVPAYAWRHGCGPTAAGMVIGYWDGNGYPALIPGSAVTQTAAVNQAITSGDLSGSNNCGIPGSGHFEDYSCPKDSSSGAIAPDKSSTGGAHGSECLGDFMRTSWSSASLYYGWSYYSDVDNSLLGYVGYANSTYGQAYIARSSNETWGTFTWSKYVAEIDAGRPMVFLVDTDGNGGTDHFVTAIGYRDTSGYQEYACYDTWSVTGYRWERFRQMASGRPWGVYGATYFRFVIPASGQGPIDIVFLIDTTGSTSGLIGTWKTKIPAVIGAIKTARVGSRFGLASHRDYPFPNYGGPADWAYRLEAPLTTNTAPGSVFDTKLNALASNGGADTPESQCEAIYQVLTPKAGRDLNYDGDFIDTGEISNTLDMNFALNQTLLIHLTWPAVFHNAPAAEPGYPYTGSAPAATWTDVLTAVGLHPGLTYYWLTTGLSLRGMVDPQTGEPVVESRAFNPALELAYLTGGGACDIGLTGFEDCVLAAVSATPDQPAIPTVSEWGLVVLALLLLTGSKVYFGRRRAAARG